MTDTNRETCPSYESMVKTLRDIEDTYKDDGMEMTADLFGRARSYIEALRSERDTLTRQRDALQAVVDRLPKTADGVPVFDSIIVYYPHRTGVVKCETMCSTDGWVAVACSQEDAKRIDYEMINVASCYSTESAALSAAKDKQ